LKKLLCLIFLVLILSGCATYKFQKPATSNAQGYLACYDGKPILEYTVGKEKSLPDLALAKERFKRRRSTVEYYYKKMDKIESRFKEYFWDTPKILVDLVGGVLRWPFTAVSDYKYNRNPKYKEKVDKLDEQKEELEKIRVNALNEKLAAYIVQDLNKEASQKNAVAAALEVAKIESTPEIAVQPEVPVIAEVVAPPLATEAKLAPVAESISAPAEEQVLTPVMESAPAPAPIQRPVTIKPAKKIKPVKIIKPIVEPVLVPPVAVITAKPVKGSSPLKVNFSAQKSHSQSGKIVAYDWDFGDGDTSTKMNVENTYWSTTFGSRNFTATLTVRDDAGSISSSSIVIEVITK